MEDGFEKFACDDDVLPIQHFGEGDEGFEKLNVVDNPRLPAVGKVVSQPEGGLWEDSLVRSTSLRRGTPSEKVLERKTSSSSSLKRFSSLSEFDMRARRRASLHRGSVDVLEAANLKTLSIHKNAEEYLQNLTDHRAAVALAYAHPTDQNLPTLATALEVEQGLISSWLSTKRRLELSLEEQAVWAVYVRKADLYESEEKRKRFIRTVDAAMKPRYDIRLLSEKALETCAKNKMEAREQFLVQKTEEEASLQKHLTELENEASQLHASINGNERRKGAARVQAMQRYILVKEELIPVLIEKRSKLLEKKPPELSKQEESAWRGLEAMRRERVKAKDAQAEREHNIVKAKKAFAKARKPDEYMERHTVRVKQAFERQTSKHVELAILYLRCEVKAVTKGVGEIGRLLGYHTAEEGEEKLFLMEWQLKLEEQKVVVEQCMSFILDMRREDEILAELDESERVLERTMAAEARQKEDHRDQAFLETIADLNCLEANRHYKQQPSTPKVSPRGWVAPSFSAVDLVDGRWLLELKKELMKAIDTATGVSLPHKESDPVHSDPALYYFLERTDHNATYTMLQMYMEVVEVTIASRRQLLGLLYMSACAAVLASCPPPPTPPSPPATILPALPTEHFKQTHHSAQHSPRLVPAPRPTGLTTPVTLTQTHPPLAKKAKHQKAIKYNDSFLRLINPEPLPPTVPIQWCLGGTVQIPQLMKSKKERNTYLGRLAKREKALDKRQRELLVALTKSREQRYS